jgi:hypothetical protein
MSTFTNVLQQRINSLKNKIRNLQEQNNNLRRRARYLMEAAPSADMSMLPVADASQVSDHYGVFAADPFTYSTPDDRNPHNRDEDPGWGYGEPFGDDDNDGYLNYQDIDWIMHPGHLEDGTYTGPDGTTYTLTRNHISDAVMEVVYPNGTRLVFYWNSDTGQWQLTRPKY